MQTTDQDLLRNIPLFAQLSEQDRRDLAGMMESRTYAAYQPVFWIGEKGEELFVVQHGKVRLSYPDEDGHEVTVAVLGPGQFFGEISLLDGGPRTATARTETDAGMMALNRQTFYRFLERHPSAAIHMVAVLSQRQREAMTKLRQVRNVNEEVEQRMTPFQRVVDRGASAAASVPFLLFNLIFIAAWITFHSLTYGAARAKNPSLPPVFFNDTPPTFFWLSIIIALESIMLTIFVLNSQRRSAERDRIRAELEYQVNLKAQHDVTQLHQKVDRLQEAVAVLGGVPVTAAPEPPPTAGGQQGKPQ